MSKSDRIFRGIVRHGDGRGKQLGYPTANIHLHRPDVREGVYFGLTTLQGQTYPSIIFIGAAKTFNAKQRWLETHLLDFNKNIYGQRVSVRLFTYVRGNRKFDSIADLVQAMRKDERKARAYFQQYVQRHHPCL